jgi:hypothetical protein
MISENQNIQLTSNEIEQIRAIREKGFAVVIITPSELDGVEQDDIEDRLIELSWQVMDDLRA